MLQDFRKFITRGNVVELAVGIVIGAAFTGVVTSFVNDVLMPPIGLALGGANFGDLFVALDGRSYPSVAAARAAGAATLNYGLFVNSLLNFLIVGFAVFLLVRALTRVTARPAAAPAPASRACPYCTLSIPVGATRCPQCTSDVRAAA
ncbi:MAG: large conductance mechanosensitive channel protein MscL [Candidatus Rokubacteria bacterium]|nr:large conductance mechanosensitive channel protein MscL [Candidatus Rokubacteria bacterium]